jgi:hypothetical protein
MDLPAALYYSVVDRRSGGSRGIYPPENLHKFRGLDARIFPIRGKCDWSAGDTHSLCFERHGFSHTENSRKALWALATEGLATAESYSVFASTLSSTLSAAARLQPMRRSFTSFSRMAPPDTRGPVIAKRSARSTLPK